MTNTTNNSNKGYTISFFIVEKGERYIYPNGFETASSAGHMFYTISDGTAAGTRTYGLHNGYASNGQSGYVSSRDATGYPDAHLAGQGQISYDQYRFADKYGLTGMQKNNDFFDVPSYDSFTNSCVDFVWTLANKMGLVLPDYQGFEGDMFPGNNYDDINEKLNLNSPGVNNAALVTDTDQNANGVPDEYEDWLGDYDPYMFNTIFDAAKDALINLFNKAKQMFSPLVLDLDGDGVSTSGLNDNIYFDHNGDVIDSYDANATGAYAGKDKIVFGKDVTADMVGYRREANNLIITVGSQGDQITINNYFASAYYRTINRFEFADGTVWNANGKVDASFGYNETPAPAKPMAVEAQVNSLISAMAAFAPESGSASSLPTHTYDPNSVMLVSSAA